MTERAPNVDKDNGTATQVKKNTDSSAPRKKRDAAGPSTDGRGPSEKVGEGGAKKSKSSSRNRDRPGDDKPEAEKGGKSKPVSQKSKHTKREDSTNEEEEEEEEEREKGEEGEEGEEKGKSKEKSESKRKKRRSSIRGEREESGKGNTSSTPNRKKNEKTEKATGKEAKAGEEEQHSRTKRGPERSKDRAAGISGGRGDEDEDKKAKGDDGDEESQPRSQPTSREKDRNESRASIAGQDDAVAEVEAEVRGTKGEEEDREINGKKNKSSGSSKKSKERRKSKAPAAAASVDGAPSEDRSSRRASKDVKGDGGDAGGESKKKKRRRSSASRKETPPPSSNEMETGEDKALGDGAEAGESVAGTKTGGKVAASIPKNGSTRTETVAKMKTEREAEPAETAVPSEPPVPSEPTAPASTAATAEVVTAKGEPKKHAGKKATGGGVADDDGNRLPGAAETPAAGADRPDHHPPAGDAVELEAPPRSGPDPPEATAPLAPPAPKEKAAKPSGSGAALSSSAVEDVRDSTIQATSAAGTAEPSSRPPAENDVAGETHGGLGEGAGVEVAVVAAATGAGAGVGGEGGGLSPTPPRARSNPIGRGTPPRRGSRGGNLAICTQQSWPPEGRRGEDDEDGGGRNWPKPTSPRSRPRDQPLVRAKIDVARGAAGDEAGGDDDDDTRAGEATEKVTTFSSRRWKASDEYLLDEDRETPRGGVFAKIPGLDQHLAVEAKKTKDPPTLRPPKLLCGTVRQYNPEEASQAAFRYPECRGAVFRPSYADDGSFDDLPATSPLLSEPPHRLRLERVRGYHGGGFYPSTDTNAYYLRENHMPKGGGAGGGGAGAGAGTAGREEHMQRFFEVVYPTAALVVMQMFPFKADGRGQEEGGERDRDGDGRSPAAWAGRSGNAGAARDGDGEMMPRFFDGHTDDVTALAVHPGGVVVASGQVGRNPDVLVWNTRAECAEGGAGVLNAQKAIIATLKGHERKVCCLDFSPDGWLLCSVGADCKSTTNIWDWRKGVAITKVQAGPGPIHAFRFNPYQAYGIPSRKPVPGQALHMDDACYCLVSIGVRHSRFWLLTRGLDDDSLSKDATPPVLAKAKWTSSQRVHEEREKEIKGRGDLTWILDGSSPRLNGKGSAADFTCMTFIDDSPPLQTWGANNTVVESAEESDRSSGRVVLGTAAGDLYIFIQRGVRLIPREFAKDVKQGKGGDGIFLDPWWLFGPGHEVTANKRLWDLGAELVDNIPHSNEAANDLVLSDKAKERVRFLEKKMAVKPLHPAVFEELKRQHDRFSYTGPLTGHTGGVSALAFNRETGKVVSAGNNGEIVQWQAFFFDPAAGAAVSSPVRQRAPATSAVPDGTPAPAATTTTAVTAETTKNNSLVGLINARRNRNEDRIQRSLLSRDPSEPRLRRVGHEAPRGDGRIGGVDVFEMDYQTTLGREDEGEFSLSDFAEPSRRSLARGASRLDMFGASGRRDGFESSSTRASFERSGSEETRRGSKDGGGRDAGGGGGSTGMGLRLEASAETGLRVKLDFPGSRSPRAADGGSEPGSVEKEEAAVAEGKTSTPREGERAAAPVSRKRTCFLPRGSHCKSLVWSKDGERLLTGLNTNVLLLLEYPADDRAASLRSLVRGHTGSVMALAVFERTQEYVTAGYDRSVAVWNTDSHLPVAWCQDLPSQVSCLACSPSLDEVAVGTVNTNEIIFLRVHRAPPGPESLPRDKDKAGPATRIELHHSKQLLPASAWARRRQPCLNARWITTAPSWDKCQIVTLDGKDTPHVTAGGAASYGGTSGGGGAAVAAPCKPHSTSKTSPVRARATSASVRKIGQGDASAAGDPPTPPQQGPSRPGKFGAARGSGEGEDDHSSMRGRRRSGEGGGEPPRSMGASCMRFSPSGSHLAIGCKNGSLVVMAVETEGCCGGDGDGEGAGDRDEPRRNGPDETADHPRNREGTGKVGGDGSSEVAEDGREKEGGEASKGGEGGRERGVDSFTSSSHRRRQRGCEEPRRFYRRIAHLKGHSSRVLHLDWTVDGRFIHTCGQDHHILHWEILPPPPHRRGEGAGDGGGGHGDRNGEEDDAEAVAGDFRPRMFKRAFLLRDEQWATWSSTIGWPVQGVFPAYSDNSDVNAVDVCPNRELLAAADDAKTVRLLRYPVLRGGARHRSYTAHSSHVMGARFTVGVEPTRLITLGGMDSTVIQWVVEDTPSDKRS